jgi:uncharacterized protein (TIGR03435 family)
LKIKFIFVCAIVPAILLNTAPNWSASANVPQQAAQAGASQQSTQSGTLGSSQSDTPTGHPRNSEFSVGPCTDNSTLPQAPFELLSAAQEVANGALPRYEYLAFVMKPHDPASVISVRNGRIFGNTGSVCPGYFARNVSILFLMQTAFGVDGEKFVGGPKWLDDEKYDVSIDLSPATLDAIDKLDPAARLRAGRAAMAKLLASRLQLSTHRETKNHPVYALVMGKRGSKFHEAAQSDSLGTGLTVEMDSHGGYVLTGRAARIGTLTVPLQKVLEHSVVDRTGLTGLYDFTLTYQPVAQHFTSMAQMNAAKLTVESVYKQPVSEAVDKQLGLKLESSTDAVEVIVIDHIEKPTKN